MSVIRLFHWKCNECGIEVSKQEYGLPRKWIYIMPRILDKEKGIKHVCLKCQKKDGTARDTYKKHEETLNELIAVMWTGCTVCNELLYLKFKHCPHCGTKRE